MNIRVIANILHTGRLKNKILSPNAWHVLDSHSCSINSYSRFEYWQFCQSVRDVESTRSRRTQTLISSEVGYTHRANDILTNRKN